MSLSRAASLVGLMVTREKLLERASELEFALGAAPAHESLIDKGVYGVGKRQRHIKDSVYWCPRLREILCELEATDPGAAEEGMADTSMDSGYASGGGDGAAQEFRPTTLRALDLRKGGRTAQGGDLTATRAGYETAQFLRGLDYCAVWVRPRLEPILPHDELSLWESSLLKLIASAVGAFCHLVPRPGGLRNVATLSRANFALVAAGRPGSIEAGLAILDRLAAGPLLDLDGQKRLVVIVDELDTAEHRGTLGRLTRLVRALVLLCARNGAPLIFTVKKQSVVLQDEGIM